MTISRLAIVAALALASFAACAQTIKIGFITSYSGLNANLGPYMERAVRLYIKQHQKDLPPGVKIELLVRDDTGVNPDRARQLAQELVVREKVNLLAGVVFTPNAMAIAPIATEAKVPFVIMNADLVITTRRVHRATVHLCVDLPLGQWAAKRFKTVYSMVSDFGPGHDSEEAFAKGFTEGGGKIVGTVRVPLQNPDFAAYMQRVKDAKPDALMVFIPAGKTATAVMKNFSDLGLGQAGIKLIGPGDITTDEDCTHGRHRARRADSAPLLGGRHPPREQGLRRRVEEGIRRQRGAQLPLRRLLGRHRAHLRGNQAAEGQAQPGQDDGDLQVLEMGRQPARPDLDRPGDARRGAQRIPARGAQGRRPARQRGIETVATAVKDPGKEQAEEEVVSCGRTVLALSVAFHGAAYGMIL